MIERNIPFSPPDITESEINEVIEALRSGWITTGPKTKELEKKGMNSQQHLQSKGQALQAAAANFQQGLQSNKYTQEQAQSIQANLQKQNSDLEALQQRLAAEFQTTQDEFNKALHDSIQNFLAVYNKDKKYAYILSKQGDNILWADPANDITKEVIEGLNKAYKPGKKIAAKEEETETKK